MGQLSSDAVIQAVGSMIAGISGSRPPPEALSMRGSHPAERYHACRLVASRVRVSGRMDGLGPSVAGGDAWIAGRWAEWVGRLDRVCRERFFGR